MPVLEQNRTITTPKAETKGHSTNGYAAGALPTLVWEATVDHLMCVEGKAELVHGRLMHLPMTGDEPNYAAGKVYMSLFQRAERTKGARAYRDGAGFLCDLPHRHSFEPDAAYYTGPRSKMRFLPQPPDFAVEVRSENDHTVNATRDMLEKREDYFAAGTQVVWDVDVQDDAAIVRKYVAPSAAMPQATFGRGAMADAEPAVSNWKMAVHDLFAPSEAN